MMCRIQPSTRSSSHGFSLIEVLIAIVILGVGIVGLTEGISTALYSSRDAEKLTVATYLAAGQIELIRADGSLTEGTEEGQWSGPLSGYQYLQTISENSDDGLYLVSVIILNRTPEKIFNSMTYLYDPVPGLSGESDQNPETSNGSGGRSNSGRARTNNQGNSR
ncbi:MAG: prepilin-type N-terminal cleavage/methylation domain-containing protein [Verrucomicrobia bacterium]|nr:prepilin-type N-terminal cleavage/methylation domain-containing protein [Verrucomicrobiota bacterium]